MLFVWTRLVHPRRSTLGIQSPIVSILLQHFRWNRERLIDRYMDDSAAVLADAGEPDALPSSPNPRPSKRARLDTSSATDFMCAICCDTEPEDVVRLRCGHEFCEACWATYVTSKIKEEGQCLFNCMQDGCRTAVDEASLEKLVPAAVFQRCVDVRAVLIYGMSVSELRCSRVVSEHSECGQHVGLLCFRSSFVGMIWRSSRQALTTPPRRSTAPRCIRVQLHLVTNGSRA